MNFTKIWAYDWELAGPTGPIHARIPLSLRMHALVRKGVCTIGILEYLCFNQPPIGKPYTHTYLGHRQVECWTMIGY